MLLGVCRKVFSLEFIFRTKNFLAHIKANGSEKTKKLFGGLEQYTVVETSVKTAAQFSFS